MTQGEWVPGPPHVKWKLGTGFCDWRGMICDIKPEEKVVNDKIKLNDVEVPVDEAVAALQGLGFNVSKNARTMRKFGGDEAVVRAYLPDGRRGPTVALDYVNLSTGQKVQAKWMRKLARNINNACDWLEE